MSEATKLMTIPEDHVLGSITSPFSSNTTARTTRAYRSMSLPTISTTATGFARNNNLTPDSPIYPFIPSLHTNHLQLTTHQSPTYYPQLPSDPKSWSSAHVAAYLSYCLRSHPPAIVRDLSQCVQDDVTLTGRRFLRLKEEQLKQMGFSERWIILIMMGVKTLRRDNLTQKILNKSDGGINGIEEIDEDMIEEENESVSDDHVSEITTTSSLATAVSTSPPTVCGNENEKATLNHHLTDSDKEYIRQELMNLKESLEKDLSSSWRFPAFWQTFSFASSFTGFMRYGNARFSYGRGLVHGAMVGGMVVLFFLRLTAKC